MPVLESPEVIVDQKISGLTIFRQQATRVEQDNTDVGINDRTGLNVISTAIELYQVTPQNDPATSLRMIIRLDEAWSGANAFVKSMKDEHGVTVALSTNPFDTARTTLSVTGIKDIEKLTEVFRTTQFVSHHDGADIHRQMVNPALLGEALDKAELVVAAHKNRKTSDWGKAFLGYGWNG